MPEDEKKEGENAADSQIDTGKNMLVKVYSPYKVYFDGLALSTSAESRTGAFDILPKHHNFITLLEPCDMVIRVEGQDDQIIPISGGIMHVKADQVTVFLDI
jgi:F0F1-type ATP synthase epsilon subunit